MRVKLSNMKSTFNYNNITYMTTLTSDSLQDDFDSAYYGFWLLRDYGLRILIVCAYLTHLPAYWAEVS